MKGGEDVEIAFERALRLAGRERSLLSGLNLAGSVRILRRRLRMTQAQLARRAGLPQPHVARIESGRGDVRLKTLERLLGAMFCDAFVLPLPRADLRAVTEERLQATARKRAARSLRTLESGLGMSAQDTAMHVVRFEEQRLRLKNSPLDWDGLAERAGDS
jgi:transcriptional regulator with XRE-family HTH domain